jgi:sulfatase modifying factor 1
MRNSLDQYPALKTYLSSLRPLRAGTFRIGSKSLYDAQPVHPVRLSAFRMGATPVTVGMWKEYCSATKQQLSEPPEWGWRDDHPIVNVTWNEIMGADGKGGFCAWASKITGQQLTLPTEAEFEYASIGGQSGLVYPWGNKFDESKLWCSNITERQSPVPVNRSSNVYRNAFGLTDLCGNVWQWCFDKYDEYPEDAVTNPRGPVSTSDNRRCRRGGSFLNGTDERFQCAYRNVQKPDDGRYDTGFRLVARSG